MNLHQSRFWQRAVRPVAASMLAAASLAVAAANVTLQGLPDEEEPAVKINPPSTTYDITQTREQNAVTSVRVRRGDNTYYVKPHDYAAPTESGGRAAQWQIFEFNRKTKPAPALRKEAAPPPVPAQR